MKNSIIILSIALILSSVVSGAIQEDKTYVFRVEKEGFYIRPVSLNVFNSQFSESSNINSGEYSAILMKDKLKLYSVKFELKTAIMANPSEYCFKNPETAGCDEEVYYYIDDSFSEAIINFPYDSEANVIEVFHKNNFLFRFDFDNSNSRGLLYRYKWPVIAGASIIGILLLIFLVKRVFDKQNPRPRNERRTG